jgi:hypothetical protein
MIPPQLPLPLLVLDLLENRKLPQKRKVKAK